MTDNLPALNAPRVPLDQAHLPPLPSGVWLMLADSLPIILTPGEVDSWGDKLDEAVAYAEARLKPATRDQRAQAIAMIGTLPSADTSEIGGEALAELYHMALDDIPLDALRVAVRAAVRDTTPSKQRRSPGFRPSPNELRAYAEPELDDRKRRLDRLIRIRSRRNDRIRPRQQMGEVHQIDDRISSPQQADEINEILAKAGASMRYRPDGTTFKVDKKGEEPRAHRGPPRMPTQAEIAEIAKEMGLPTEPAEGIAA